MATLILGLFRTRHNGLLIPRRETAVTVAKTHSTESSIPTTRIQPAATAPSAIVPNRNAATCIQSAVGGSFSLAAGYFHKRCIPPRKETLLYISELVGSGSSS